MCSSVSFSTKNFQFGLFMMLFPYFKGHCKLIFHAQKVLMKNAKFLFLFQALNYLPNLEEVNASGNRLRSVSDISKCKRLSEIDLSGNRITDLSGLRGLPKLLVSVSAHDNAPITNLIFKEVFI
jgi:Leucine-rich repeat (LRR) protein